jgi:dipeptidase D
MNRYSRVTGFCILPVIFLFAGCRAYKNTAFSQGNEMATEKITLKEAKAQNVWEYFRQVSAIPRCSKNEKQIMDWLKGLAKSRNLVCRSDDVDNVIIELPATKSYENVSAVVLQSHVDMVCEKTPESKHDFTKDPIELVERDGWVTADGTTLGSDDGVGVALALALIDEKISHPKLELLFTVDEETGLTGANGLKPGFITGQYLINLDGEDKSFIVGCAGGEQTEIRLPLEFSPVPDSLACFDLKISGLHGGHSGIDIDKQYANAIQLLGKTLKGLQNFDLRICSIEGGTVHNAIPRDAKAIICFDASKLSAAKKALAEIESSFKKEFTKTEPNLKLELIKAAERTENNQLTRSVIPESCLLGQEQGTAIINLLTDLPTGVYKMSSEFNGIVETSSNLAKVEILSDEKKLRILISQRSLEKSSLKEVTAKITGLARSAGAKVNTLGGYPSWKPDVNSSLLKRAKEIYRKLNNKQAQVKVVHAGLEPAVIGEKFHGIEMISVGPTIKNPHSPQERVDIASVDAVWEFLLELIPALK